RDIDIADELQRPVVDPRSGRVFRRSGELEALARRALVVAEPAVARIGDGGVREQQLARRKCARIRFGDERAVAEESYLDAEAVNIGIASPAGDIPPFAAKGRVRARVARKADRMTGDHARIVVFGASSASQDKDRDYETP